MIDTSKYEGHTPAPWEVRTYYDTTCVCYSKDDNSECSFVKIHEEHENEQDVQLMADAPLLLAEVKRLRRLNNYLWEHRSSHWSADDDAEMDRLEMIE